MPKTTPKRLTLDYAMLRRARRMAEISQTEMARLTGMQVAKYARIEQNRADPTLPQMVAAARALRLPIHQLYTLASVEKDHAA